MPPCGIQMHGLRVPMYMAMSVGCDVLHSQRIPMNPHARYSSACCALKQLPVWHCPAHGAWYERVGRLHDGALREGPLRDGGRPDAPSRVLHPISAWWSRARASGCILLGVHMTSLCGVGVLDSVAYRASEPKTDALGVGGGLLVVEQPGREEHH